MLRNMQITFGVLAGLLVLATGIGFPVHAQEYTIGNDARPFLEKAKQLDASNYAVLYYLGVVRYKEKDYEGAIEEWDKYVEKAPDSDVTTAVKERLTLLKLKEATVHAKGQTGDIPENTIAVLNFRNKGPAAYNALSKGLTAMIITDLSKVPQLSVLEREKMNVLLDEIALEQLGVVDPATAPKLGKTLFARKLVSGEFTEPKPDEITISSSVVETLNAINLGTSTTEGKIDDFFDLQKEIVFGILESLGLKGDLDPELENSIRKKHTNDMKAFTLYSQGLDFMDNNMFSDAKSMFDQAVATDPEFDLAKDAMISVPEDTPLPEDVDFMDFQARDAASASDSQTQDVIQPLDQMTNLDVIADEAQKVNIVESKGKAIFRW